MTNMKKWVQILIVAILLLSFIGPASATPAPGSVRVHPALIQIANETPELVVSVIVGKADQSGQAEQRVASFGGVITKDLHIINAFAADLPAKVILELLRLASVSWVSMDAPVHGSGSISDFKKPKDPQQPWPQNTFLDSLGVRQVWEQGYQGDGVTVAVIDSGIFQDRDFTLSSDKRGPDKNITRILENINFTSYGNFGDDYGHGTHVAGIIGGHGGASDGAYSGIAPQVNLINLKISDNKGMAYESDVVSALQWVYDNKDAYNIRIVNLSIQSTAMVPYHQSPMDAAAEILWFNGVVVVAAAGNWDSSGFNPLYAAPANDPFIITVGASDEQGTAARDDDVLASFSASDGTQNDISKPEVLAPGKDIVSVLSYSSDWGREHPGRVVLYGEYFRLSGTSMAASMVTGAAALLLQAEPELTPDQVKYRLINTGGQLGSDSYLDVYAALVGTTTESANTGLTASQLLWTGEDPVAWDSVSWNSVSWNSVSWNSVSWNSVSWNSVSWNSVFWDD